MKKQILFIIALFALSISYGQTVIYQQDFNGSTIPNQWFLENEGTGTHDWTFGSGDIPYATDFSTNAAIFDDDAAGNSGNHDVALLCYPYNIGVLNLSSYTDKHIEMEYEYALNVSSSGDETLEFLVKDSAAGDWIIVKTYSEDINPTLEKIDITQLMIDYPGIDETNFYFAFRYDDINSDWAYGAGIDNVKFTAYDPPYNNTCNHASQILVGHDFDHYAIETSLEHTTATNGSSFRNAWYYFTVPASGSVTIETKYAPGSAMHDTYMMVYSGDCGSLVYINDNDNGGEGNFSKVVLSGQTPGDIIKVSIEEDMDSTDPLDTFLISAYDSSVPAAPVNDLCNNATTLTIGNSFGAHDVVGTLESATEEGSFWGWRGVWFSCVVPPTGNVTIETDYDPGSAMHDTYMVVISACGATTLLAEDDDNGNGNFAKVVLTGLTPGENLIIEIEEDATSIDPLDTFLISAYSLDLSVEDTVIKGFSMYPNPVNETLNLSAINTIDEVSIYNLLGEKVLELTPKAEKTNINVSDLSTGTYVLKVQTANQLGSYKFIKE
jgi:hypothetical protein